MKYFKFIILGILFGIVLTKAQIISWYRIQEMFRFQSFHMYGVIGSAVILGAFFMAVAKKLKVKTFEGKDLEFPKKERGWKRYLFGGTVFGLGWAMTGACPGPVYILIGYGYTVFIVVLLSALLGTYFYGIFKNKLPH